MTTSPDPDGAGPLTAHVNTMTVDPKLGVPTKEVAPGGETTEASYDSHGRITEVWAPGRSKATQSASMKFSYVVSKTAANAVTTQTLNWNQAYITSTTLYDGLLRERQTRIQEIDRQVNTSGQVITTTGRRINDLVYDDRGLTVAERGPFFATGAPSTTMVQVADSAVPSMTTTTYDGAGRPTVETLKALGVTEWSTSYAYGGDRVDMTPPSGDTATTTIHDAAGRTTTIRQYTGATPTGTYDASAYTYDAAGRLTKFKDAMTTEWTYGYDVQGRQVSASDPDTGVTTKAYDAAGQLITTTDARGKTLAYTYDQLGRKTSLRDGSVTGPLRAAWTYDTVKKGYETSSARYVAGQPVTSAVTSRDVAGRPRPRTPRCRRSLGGWRLRWPGAIPRPNRQPAGWVTVPDGLPGNGQPGGGDRRDRL